MQKYVFWICLAGFAVSIGSCNELAEITEISEFSDFTDFFKQPAHKSIIITDSDPDWFVRISAINNSAIFLVLIKNMPSIDSINVSLMIKSSIYSIGDVKNNKINFKLYTSNLDYWTGEGKYWVIFMVPDKRFEAVSQVYASQKLHDFYAEVTRLNNIDFFPPVEADIDLSGILPF